MTRAPRFASITLSLDTELYRARRPDERRDSIFYLVDRLLAGEEVADGALEHYDIKATTRDAVGPEILKGYGFTA